LVKVIAGRPVVRRRPTGLRGGFITNRKCGETEHYQQSDYGKQAVAIRGAFQLAIAALSTKVSDALI
jgi:hypothetical protein